MRKARLDAALEPSKPPTKQQTEPLIAQSPTRLMIVKPPDALALLAVAFFDLVFSICASISSITKSPSRGGPTLFGIFGILFPRS